MGSHAACRASELRGCFYAWQTLTEGGEWKKPNQGASVKAHMVGRLQDGTVFEDADLDFVTDEGEAAERHADAADAVQCAGRRMLRHGLVC